MNQQFTGGTSNVHGVHRPLNVDSTEVKSPSMNILVTSVQVTDNKIGLDYVWYDKIYGLQKYMVYSEKLFIQQNIFNTVWSAKCCINMIIKYLNVFYSYQTSLLV